jgi:uncharacterized protein YkwD
LHQAASLSVFLLAVLAGAAQADEPYYGLINQIRTSEQSCKGVTRAALPPFTARAELEAAAREAVLGRDPGPLLQRGTYRAKRYSLLGISAPNATSVLATLRRDFCTELGDASFSEIGLQRDGGRVFIVLADPARLPDAASWRSAAHKVLELVNAARAQPRECGGVAFSAAPPLGWNDRLAAAALAHSEDMAAREYFSHDSPEGVKPAERVKRAGYAYRATGENIGAGQATPEAAVASWIASPPHCANLMRPEFTEMGAAYAVRAESKQGIYWTQNFGTPRK